METGISHSAPNGPGGATTAASSSANPSLDNNTSRTTTTIIHDDSSWSTAVRSIFIYGAAGLRLRLEQLGPRGRLLTVAGAVMMDHASLAIRNALNDPSYIRRHYVNWRAIWADDRERPGEVIIHTENDPLPTTYPEPASLNHLDSAGATDRVLNPVLTSQSVGGTSTTVSTTTGEGASGAPSFLPSEGLSGNNTFFNWSNPNGGSGISSSTIIDPLVSILKPVSVDYSNVLLAEQIYGLAIFMFILTVAIVMLFIVFLFNAIILLYREKLLNYFTNKYLVFYLKLQSKVILIEFLFLSLAIFYGLYYLLLGLHFIATHPVIIN